MDLVSFDTPGEFKMFEEIMARGEWANESSSLIYINFSSTEQYCLLAYMQVWVRNPEVVFKVAHDGCRVV